MSGDSNVVEPIEPTQDGYTFTGWYTDIDCTQQYAFGKTLSENITLYAGFGPVTYTVTYDGGEGSNLVTDVKTHGEALTLRGETFTMDGFVQTSWVDKARSISLAVPIPRIRTSRSIPSLKSSSP